MLASAGRLLCRGWPEVEGRTDEKYSRSIIAALERLSPRIESEADSRRRFADARRARELKHAPLPQACRLLSLRVTEEAVDGD